MKGKEYCREWKEYREDKQNGKTLKSSLVVVVQKMGKRYLFHWLGCLQI